MMTAARWVGVADMWELCRRPAASRFTMMKRLHSAKKRTTVLGEAASRVRIFLMRSTVVMQKITNPTKPKSLRIAT